MVSAPRRPQGKAASRVCTRALTGRGGGRGRKAREQVGAVVDAGLGKRVRREAQARVHEHVLFAPRIALDGLHQVTGRRKSATSSAPTFHAGKAADTRFARRATVSPPRRETSTNCFPRPRAPAALTKTLPAGAPPPAAAAAAEGGVVAAPAGEGPAPPAAATGNKMVDEGSAPPAAASPDDMAGGERCRAAGPITREPSVSVPARPQRKGRGTRKSPLHWRPPRLHA
jgi:hypothetical protein